VAVHVEPDLTSLAASGQDVGDQRARLADLDGDQVDPDRGLEDLVERGRAGCGK
jgi:hypothetical protein